MKRYLSGIVLSLALLASQALQAGEIKLDAEKWGTAKALLRLNNPRDKVWGERQVLKALNKKTREIIADMRVDFSSDLTWVLNPDTSGPPALFFMDVTNSEACSVVESYISDIQPTILDVAPEELTFVGENALGIRYKKDGQVSVIRYGLYFFTLGEGLDPGRKELPDLIDVRFRVQDEQAMAENKFTGLSRAGRELWSRLGDHKVTFASIAKDVLKRNGCFGPACIEGLDVSGTDWQIVKSLDFQELDLPS